MPNDESFVGIDVSKAVLDVAIYPTGEHWKVPNDPDGIGDLVSRLEQLAPERIVLEATGGLRLPLSPPWAALDYPLWRSTRGRRVTLLERRAVWRKQTRWMHRCWLNSRQS